MKQKGQAFLKSPAARRIRLAALVFALLFTLTALAQYLFLWNQITRRTQSEFLDWGTELKRELNYQGKWHLREYRQAEWSAPGCVISTPAGTLLDVQGFVPGLLGRVTPPQGLQSNRSVTITNEIGEPWRINSKQLPGALVLAGSCEQTELTNLDALLDGTLRLFGSTLSEARKVTPRDVNRIIDYAVIDDSGTLISAIGGLPLRELSPEPQNIGDSIQHATLDGKRYAIFRSPVTFQNQVVAWLTIPRDVTPEYRTLRNSVWFNVVLAICSWSVLAVLTATYFVRLESVRRAHQLSFQDARQQPESDTLEFKSSLRWDFKRQMVNPVLQQVVVKTVVAFLNTAGGILLIGVADDRTILGLQPDYDTFERPSWDAFQLHLQQLLTQAIGNGRYASHVRVELHTTESKDVCLVRVSPAPGPVVIKEQNQPTLYVRASGASKVLNFEEAVRYAQEHWGGYV